MCIGMPLMPYFIVLCDLLNYDTGVEVDENGAVIGAAEELPEEESLEEELAEEFAEEEADNAA